ncbi:MAG: hypothetical protein ACXWRG_18330 [Bdellovibrio sp.]
MRILIIATFIVFLFNALVKADVLAPQISEKIFFCKSDIEHVGLINFYNNKETAAVLAEAKEINKTRVYILSVQDNGEDLTFRGESELINPLVNYEHHESDKKFTVVISKQAFNDKKPFFINLDYDSGDKISFYCKTAVKPKK